MREVVRWSLQDGGAFQYECGEQSFGHRGDAWGPLVLSAPEGPIYVRGRVDRIDISPERSRLRVIDYKTGTAPPWRWIGRRRFQPALYANVACREFGPLFIRQVYALYLETGKRPVRTVPASPKQLLSPELVRVAELNSVAIVRRLHGGDFAPRPAEAQLCDGCAVRAICRRPLAAPMPEADPEADDNTASATGIV